MTAASSYLEPSPIGSTITRQDPHQHPISQRRLGQGSGGDGQGCGTGVRPNGDGESTRPPPTVFIRQRRGVGEEGSTPGVSLRQGAGGPPKPIPHIGKGGGTSAESPLSSH
jgi:hypothetical protein